MCVEIGECDRENEEVYGTYDPIRRHATIPSYEDAEIMETLLLHELSHASLQDEGYRPLVSNSEDDVCRAFANFIHHIVIAGRFRDGGIMSEKTDGLLLARIDQLLTRRCDALKRATFSNPDSHHWVILDLLQFRYSLTNMSSVNFLAEKMEAYFPNIWLKINQEGLGELTISSVKCYEDTKKYIERVLMIDPPYSFKA